MEADDFKLNRRAIARRLEEGLIREASAENSEGLSNEFTKAIAKIIGNVIGKPADEIQPGADIFFDLGVNSLDYYTIIMDLQKEFGMSLPQDTDKSFKTVTEIAEYIEAQRKHS